MQLSDIRTRVALVLFSDAAKGGTTFQNGYFLEWLTNSDGSGALALYKRVAGVNYAMYQGGANIAYGQNIPPVDTAFHTFTLVAEEVPFTKGTANTDKNVAGLATPGVFFLIGMDNVLVNGPVDYVPGYLTASGVYGQPNFVSAGVGGVPPFTSGRCGLNVSTYDAPVALDPKTFELDTATTHYFEDPSQDTSENLVWNPTAANNDDGWSNLASPGMTAFFGRDGYLGGRLYCGATAGPAGPPQDVLRYQQYVAVPAAGQLRNVTGLYELGGKPNASQPDNGGVVVDVYDTVQNVALAQVVRTTHGRDPFLMQYVASGNPVLLRLRTYGTNVSGLFYQLCDKAGPMPPATFTDAQSAGVVPTTHTLTPDAAGSNLRSDVVNSNQISGLSNTPGPVGDGTNLYHGIMSPGTQQGVTAVGQLIGVGQSESFSFSTPFFEGSASQNSVDYAFGFSLPNSASGATAYYQLDMEWDVNVSDGVQTSIVLGGGIAAGPATSSPQVAGTHFAFAKATGTCSSGTFYMTAEATPSPGHGAWNLATNGVVTVKATRYA